MLFTAIVCGPVWALEISTEFQIGNLGFADTRESSATDYPKIYPWGLALYGSQDISDGLRIDTGFFYDQTLRYISYTLLQYSQQFFTLGVGPFFGFFNSETSLLKPGISTAIRIDFPGLVFIEFRADSSIGGRMVKEGDYLQERGDLTAGLYVLNAIVSLNLLTKSYTYRSATEEVIDDFVEYSFRTDIYQKNVPFNVLLSFAYQKRGKYYTNMSTLEEVTHEFNSLILGTRLKFQVTDYLSLVTDLESSIFSFGSAGDILLALPAVGLDAYFFNFSAGMTLDLDRVRDRRGDL